MLKNIRVILLSITLGALLTFFFLDFADILPTFFYWLAKIQFFPALLAHLIPQGGRLFLPIYFFTLLGAYKYGWKVGILTAILSPLLSNYLTGLPTIMILNSVITKSILIVLVTKIVSSRKRSFSIWNLIIIVCSYQILGSMVDSIVSGDYMLILNNLKFGIIGMILQVLLCYILLAKKRRNI